MVTTINKEMALELIHGSGNIENNMVTSNFGCIIADNRVPSGVPESMESSNATFKYCDKDIALILATAEGEI